MEVKGLSKEYYNFRLKIAVLRSLVWYIYLVPIMLTCIVYLLLYIYILILVITIFSILMTVIQIYCLRWYYRKYVNSYEYEITEEEVIIREGVFRRYESRVPFSRIQNIGIHQKFWEKRYGWYEALIQTAGGSIRKGRRAEVCIIGLRDPIPIQELILKYANKYMRTRITGLEEVESFQEGYHISMQVKKKKLNYKEYNQQLEKIISSLKTILEKI